MIALCATLLMFVMVAPAGGVPIFAEVQSQANAQTTLAEARKLKESIRALASLPPKEIVEKLPQALKDGKRALAVFTLADHPNEYSILNRDLAILCDMASLFADDPTELCTAAVSFAKAALSVKGGQVESEWDRRHLQSIMGSALMSLGRRGNKDALRDAVTVYREKVKERTSDDDSNPLDHAELDLATALLESGKQGDAKALDESIGLFKQILKKRSRDSYPFWLLVQERLADALRVRGEKGDPSALKEARSIYEEMLEAVKLSSDAGYFARIQDSLAQTLRALDDKKAAAAAYRAAAEGYRRSGQDAEAKRCEDEAKNLAGGKAA